MKKSTTLIALLMLCAVTLFAQAPERFSYQAVVRNASNALVANAQVGVRVSILQGSASGNAVYSESHVATTNTNGLITLDIGGGSVLQGSFAGIDWASGPFFLKTETDPEGGSNYTITSTQQLLSVPYALYAKDAGNIFSGDYNDLTNVPQIPQIPADVSAFNNDAGYITGYTETDPQFNAWDKDYNDLINVPQIPQIPADVSAFNNDAGYITGYTETDPQFNAWDKDYNDLINVPQIPADVSAFNNDAGYITGYTETDPQFNAWDKDYNDLINVPQIPQIPADVSAFNNDAGYLTGYTETQNLASVTAYGNSAGNTQLKEVADPTDAQDAVTLQYLMGQLSAFSAAFQHKIDSLGGIISAQQAIINGQQALIDSIRNNGGGTSQAPTVTTDEATNVAATSATLNGTISNPESVTISGQGFEWKATDGGSYAQVSATGSTMSYTLTGLTASTGYTYRAFVTTASGTSYGSEVTFTTTDIANSLDLPDPCSVDTNTTWHATLSPGSTLCVGTDSVELALDNFQHGSIQWQYSTDTISWYNIPGAVETQLTYKPEQTEYVRAVVSYANCPPEYSPVKLLQMSPSANAGISRTANLGDTLNLHANTVEGATGEWQILQGEGGFFSSTNNSYTRFTGTDSLYSLQWTLTNSCGSNSDVVDVRFVQTVVSDRVVMVDTTDVIFSDSTQMAMGYYEISFSDPNIVIGDSTILVSLINGGFMRMVESWDKKNDTTYAMYTSQASLYDILESGVVQFDAIPAPEEQEDSDNPVNSVLNASHQQKVEFLDHIPTRQELRSNPNMTRSGTVYVLRMDLEDGNGNRVSMTRGNSGNRGSDDNEPKFMKLEWFDTDLAPDFEYELDSAHFNLDLNPVFQYDKETRHFRFGLYGANFSVGADIVPKFTPVELEVTPVEFTFLKIPEVAFAVPVGPIVIPFTVDCGANIEVKGTIGASVSARYRFNAKATFTYGVNYWGKYNDFSIDKGFDGECNMGRIGDPNLEGSVELEASIAGYSNVKLAGVVGPRVKAGYKFKINHCYGGFADAGIVGGQGKLTSELFLKLDLKGIKLVDKIIPKNWSKEWTLPVGKKHVFPDTMYLYSGNNINSHTSSPVKVKVLGSGGKPTRNAMVIFKPQDGGTVYPSIAYSDMNGIAQTIWTPSPSCDIHQLYAYVYDCEQNPIKGAPVVFTAYEFEGCASSTLELKCIASGDILTLKAEGGRPPYTYSLNGGDFVSLDNLPVLSALACHVLTVKDDNGCIRSVSYGHIDNMNCAWSDLGVDAEYSNDALNLQGTGGTPPYKYSLDGNNYSTNSVFPSLSPGVYTAYVRDYAGCEYSKEVTIEDDETQDLTSILLQACPDAITVTDNDGNVYNTVQIGDQCWMRENLRTTKKPDGSNIALNSERYCPNNDTNIVDVYGYLYTWDAMMNGASSTNANPSGVRGICPAGWHVPSDAEWIQMANYVGSQSEYTCGGSSTNIAKALASATGWTSYTSTCGVSDNQDLNNATGFSALPAGWYYGGAYSNFTSTASFWTSTIDLNNLVLRRYLHRSSAKLNPADNINKSGGCSVRCIMDEPGSATQAPTVTTGDVSSLAATSATLNGSISNPDNVPITAQGFEWKATDGGSYTQVFATGSTMNYALTSLTPATSYTYRAFVTTGFGTTYGSEVSFTTTSNSVTSGQACPGTPTVTDHEGNVYNTVQIGDQCWMRENLRTTTSPSTGTYLIPVAGTGYTYTGKQARWYNNDSTTYAPMNYGLLYNWNAAVDTFNTAYGETSVNTSSSNAVYVTFTDHRRGICPAGWHLPSDAEWTQLTEYVSSQSDYVCGGNTSYIAKALADSVGWKSSSGETCTPGHKQSANNATGFSAVPAGIFERSFFTNARSDAIIWSATQYDSDAFVIRLEYSTSVYWFNNSAYKHLGLSVRCLRDESSYATQAPTVTTGDVSSLAATSATLNGSISNPDNVPITAQGFEWKATDGGSYTQVFATGSTMNYALTSLTPATSYTYRAFVTTGFGTTYGSEVSFTTTSDSVTGGQACPGTPTVTDHEGNVYNTVQIGDQCWMKENLRTTTKPDGTVIALNSERYYPNNDANNVAVYGYLYTWFAMMSGASSSNANPSGVRGICPAGWHVPSGAEWTQLTDYVSGRNEYTCGGNSENIAKALASSTGWPTQKTTCTVGKDQNSNNATGFSAVPAGRYDGNYIGTGSATYFWRADEASNDNARIRYLTSFTKVLYYGSGSKNMGVSVRCLRD